MDFQVSVPGPFTYLVHEHARSILAIQELQREVTSLLEFRDNVLHALPHLHARAYHSLTSTHDPPSVARVSQSSPVTRGDTSPSKSGHSSHHMTSAESGRRHQRSISTSTAVTTATNSGNSSSSSSTGGKSLSETHSSAVADSGFSTDKAGGSMGKSSSSSAGDHLSGAEEHRWMSVEPELPLGSAEDELWQLLDVIQRKGTRLRNELERAERVEKVRVSQPPPNASSVSDPLTSPRPHSTYQDFWPHSLPGTVGSYPSRGDVLPPPPLPPPPPVGIGMEAEAWAAVDRLRQDRQYLVGRVNWAEAEAAASHQRLLDLHGQLLALAGDKRRLEDQIRALRLDPRLDPRLETRTDLRADPRNDLNLQFMKTNGVQCDGPASTGGIVHSVMGGVNTVHIVSDNTTATTNTSSTKSRRVPPAVTVSVASGDSDDLLSAGGLNRGRVFRSASCVRINNERDVILPRVLKVPIRDRTHRHNKQESDGKDANAACTPKETRKDLNKYVDNTNNQDLNFTTANNSKGSDRVVIERERRPGKADGGLSMPVSLLKGTRIKVQPNKQRISAILREKDVLELQRQLLTTVMETEVLKKQIETAGEEWISKTAEWETEHRFSQATITALRQENLALKSHLEERNKVDHKDASVSAQPVYINATTMTYGDDMDSTEVASHTVHPGPNIKYDVVVHEEQPRHQEPSNIAASSAASEATGRKAAPTVEKPPRRCRDNRHPTSAGVWHSGEKVRKESSGSEIFGGKDSIGRGTALRHRSNLVQTGRSTPTVTPRSSPSSSINNRPGTARPSTLEASRTTVGRSSTTANSRVVLGRRDSLKANHGNGKTSGNPGGQQKDSSVFHRYQSIINKSSSVVTGDEKAGHFLNSTESSINITGSPLMLSNLRIPSPSTTPVMSSQQQIFIKMEEKGNEIVTSDISKGFQKRLSVSDIYNYELSEIGKDRDDNKTCKILPQIQKSNSCTQRLGSLSSELHLSKLKCAPESSFSSSLTSTGSYFDSINTDDNFDDERLMHVEVAFEWNPVPTEEICYLPPAAHMWNQNSTLTPDTHFPPVRNPFCNGSACLIPTAKQSTIFDHQPLFSKNLHFDSSDLNNLQNKNLYYPVDSLEDERCFEAGGKMSSNLRSVNDAVKVKSVDHPVSSLVQEGIGEANESLSNSKDSLYSIRSQCTSPKTSSIDKIRNNVYEIDIIDSLDTPVSGHCENTFVAIGDAVLDSGVHQIIARIAENTQ